ncbi:hypothetical protein GCM10018952_05420 [Streptosporangium vulgare]
MGRNVAFVLLFLGIMIVQVTVVNRLPLPGNAAPDLVLLAVVGCTRWRAGRGGSRHGFRAGLVSDLLPPAAHLLGHNALVLCLMGFLAGRAVESQPARRRSRRWPARSPVPWSPW